MTGLLNIQVGIDWQSRDILERTRRRKQAVLQRTGARVRGYLLRSVFRRKAGPSSPGQIPHAHAQGNQGLRFLRFAVDQRIDAVLIGMIRYPRPGTHQRRQGRWIQILPIGKTVPDNVNRGGLSRITIQWDSGHTTRHFARHRARPWVRLTTPVAGTILLDSLRPRSVAV